MRSFREFMMRVSIEMLAKIKQKIRCGIGAEGDDSLCISPIHFTQLNYILKTRKQSQDIAIVIDDVVIL